MENDETNKIEPQDFITLDKMEDKDIEERRVASGKDSKESKPTTGLSEEEYLTADEVRVIQNTSIEIGNDLAAGQGPLDRPVIERGYTERQYTGDIFTPIQEPQAPPRQTIDQPQINIPPKSDQQKNVAQEIYKDKVYATESLGEKEHPRTGGNPATQNMTNKERTQNLEMTVDMAISSYVRIKEWIGGWLVISDSNLIKRQNAGKTPPDWAVLYDSSTKEVMTLREFIAEGNKRIEQACKTDEEFKKQIRPLLIAEFDRRNLIASPQQNLFLYLGQDAFSMVQKLVAIHMNLRKVINQIDKEFEDRQKNGYISPRDVYNMSRNYKEPAPAQQQYETTPTPQTTKEESKPEEKKFETITIPAEEPSLEFEAPTD